MNFFIDQKPTMEPIEVLGHKKLLSTKESSAFEPDNDIFVFIKQGWLWYKDQPCRIQGLEIIQT